MIDAISADFYMHVQNCVRAFGDCHLALSGGRSPLGLYRRLMYDPAVRDLPWKRVHIWLTSQSASGELVEPVVRGYVSDHADVPDDQVHVPGSDASGYASELREHLGWREKGHDRLDLVLLGLDEHGGVGGIAPADLPEGEEADIARPCSGGVGLSLEMINASRFVAVLATGEHKRAVLSRVAFDSGPKMPARLLSPFAGELRFYVDADACPRPEDSSC